MCGDCPFLSGCKLLMTHNSPGATERQCGQRLVAGQHRHRELGAGVRTHVVLGTMSTDLQLTMDHLIERLELLRLEQKVTIVEAPDDP
jgi:hypothetical protein